MKWPKIQVIQSGFRSEWPQIALLLGLSLFFILNVIGILDLAGSGPLGFQFTLRPFYSQDGNFQIPPILVSIEFWIMFFNGLLLSVLLPVLKPYFGATLVLLLTLPPFLLGIGFPFRESLIPMQYNLLVILMLYGINVLLGYLGETRHKQRLVNVFGLYVPPEIVKRMSRESETLDLAGESKNLTVLFGDLISFSTVSEQLSPRDLVYMLNEYFTVMTTVLYKYGATIDKYIGDSIMAFWGAPLPQEDHADRAVKASFEMHREISALSNDFIKRGWPGPVMGIGINSGMMNVGNMGSRYRLAYTVIGDAVNMSARLQSMTRVYKVPTIVGEQTAATVDDIIFRELDVINVKGKRIRSRIYQPYCNSKDLTESTRDFLARHQKALDLYYSDKIDEARTCFEALREESDKTGYYD